MYMLEFDAAISVWLAKIILLFSDIFPIVAGLLRWFNFTERWNFGIFIDIIDITLVLTL